MENISPEILGIIIRHLQQATSQPEEELLSAWLGGSLQNKAGFEEVARVWKLSPPVSETFEPNAEAAWQKVKQKTILSSQSDKGNGAKVVRLPTYIWKVAASVLLVVGFGYLVNKSVQKDVSWHTIATAGEKKMVKLPDSSEVWLNKNSNLSYTDFEGDKREVKLEGEAFFDIKRKPKQPFSIKGRESVTEVLGTSFNLRSPENGHDVVEVVTGLVAFSSIKNPDARLQLRPGQKGEIEKDGRVMETAIANKNFRSWESDRLVFDNSGLKEVTESLENHFGIDVDLDNSALANCRFTGSFEKPDLKEVLEILKLSVNLKVEQNGNQIILKGTGCP